jgi:CBS domain-containing protein/PII-like signaling protein
MAVEYQIVKIYTSEEARWQGKPLYDAVIEDVRNLKLAARCLVTRGIAGCYESGEISTQSIVDLSYNPPLMIEIILPDAELTLLLPRLETMVTDGIVTLVASTVLCYHSVKRLIPKQVKIKELMTTDLITVAPETPVAEIIRLMTENSLKGLPVVDERFHPVGMITQNDLIGKAGMPVRLGLLTKLDRTLTAPFFDKIRGLNARRIMSQPAVTVKAEQRLAQAVHAMLKQGLKRLPVVDAAGTLVGMVSRIDIFQSIVNQKPHWNKLQEDQVVVNGNQSVTAILERDLDTVNPDTAIPDVIEKIYQSELQRIAVTDGQGQFLGLIFDQDLLPLFTEPGAGEVLLSKLTFTEKGRRLNQLLSHKRAKTAADVMVTAIITIPDTASLEEAIRIMTEQGLKRLPVVDAAGIFKGMIRRDSILELATGGKESH